MNAPAAALLPEPAAWSAAAALHDELFAALDGGSRIALVARSDPTRMLLWLPDGSGGVRAEVSEFTGYAASGAQIVLSADDEALAAIGAALAAAAPTRLFETLRGLIRSGHVVCYLRERRCVLEERGFEELLDALGYVFMGACR